MQIDDKNVAYGFQVYFAPRVDDDQGQNDFYLMLGTTRNEKLQVELSSSEKIISCVNGWENGAESPNYVTVGHEQYYEHFKLKGTQGSYATLIHCQL